MAHSVFIRPSGRWHHYLGSMRTQPTPLQASRCLTSLQKILLLHMGLDALVGNVLPPGTSSITILPQLLRQHTCRRRPFLPGPFRRTHHNHHTRSPPLVTHRHLYQVNMLQPRCHSMSEVKFARKIIFDLKLQDAVSSRSQIIQSSISRTQTRCFAPHQNHCLLMGNIQAKAVMLRHRRKSLEPRTNSAAVVHL